MQSLANLGNSVCSKGLLSTWGLLFTFQARQRTSIEEWERTHLGQRRFSAPVWGGASPSSCENSHCTSRDVRRETFRREIQGFQGASFEEACGSNPWGQRSSRLSRGAARTQNWQRTFGTCSVQRDRTLWIWYLSERTSLWARSPEVDFFEVSTNQPRMFHVGWQAEATQGVATVHLTAEQVSTHSRSRWRVNPWGNLASKVVCVCWSKSTWSHLEESSFEELVFRDCIPWLLQALKRFLPVRFCPRQHVHVKDHLDPGRTQPVSEDPTCCSIVRLQSDSVLDASYSSLIDKFGQSSLRRFETNALFCHTLHSQLHRKSSNGLPRGSDSKIPDFEAPCNLKTRGLIHRSPNTSLHFNCHFLHSCLSYGFGCCSLNAGHTTGHLTHYFLSSGSRCSSP